MAGSRRSEGTSAVIAATTTEHCPWCGVRLSRTFDCYPVFCSGYCRDSFSKAEGQVAFVTPLLKETGSLSETAKRLNLSASTVARYAKAMDGSKTDRRARYIALRVREIGNIAETARRMNLARSTVARYVKIARGEHGRHDS